ncbi:hypothetical protein [Propionispora sp. 2/2-37]|uniref:hypothetical protein n=1 Tax=Propionispora sp. 2/2-37 TaxID=1677858 RepID=UPI0006BB85DB|nr:hypothetical protein [Propionispora sp. 2/2-37]
MLKLSEFEKRACRTAGKSGEKVSSALRSEYILFGMIFAINIVESLTAALFLRPSQRLHNGK